MRKPDSTARFNEPALGHAVLAFDRTGKLLDANQSACDYLGYSHAELLSLRLEQIAPEFALHDAMAELANSAARLIRRAAMHRGKTTSMIPVEMHLTELRHGPEPIFVAWIAHLKELETAITPPLEELGPILRWADDLAHRLNNLLTIVQVHASYLLGEKPLDTESKESVLEIYEAVGRAAELTGQLAAVARPARPTDAQYRF